MEEEQVHQQEKTTQPPQNNGFPMMLAAATAFPMTVNPEVLPVPIENPMENLTLAQGNQPYNNVAIATANLIRPVPIFPAPQPQAYDLNLNLGPSPLSLKLSLKSDHMESSSSSSRHSAYHVMPSEDSNSIISVA